MDIYSQSNGFNVVSDIYGDVPFYPERTVKAAQVAVYWVGYGKPVSEAQVIGIYAPGQVASHLYNPALDADVYLFTMAYSADGLPSHSSLQDAFDETSMLLVHQRETDAPTIAQVGDSTADLITLVASGFKEFAHKRKVRIADNSAMTGAIELIEDSGTERLPEVFYINRTSVASTRTNVALPSNGASASASSEVSANYPASACINGDRKGLNWGAGGGWNSGPTSNTFPDYLTIDFGQSRTISEIDIFTVQDSYASPSEPTLTDTFTLYGLTAYELQSWDGAAWVNIVTVTGNNKVWRQHTFAPLSTNKIRVKCNAAIDGFSRLIEVEAWGGAGGSLTQTIYIRVSHSSGGAYGAESATQSFMFADASNTGGSSGDGDPFNGKYYSADGL